jgi:hypothetical protein
VLTSSAHWATQMAVECKKNKTLKKHSGKGRRNSPVCSRRINYELAAVASSGQRHTGAVAMGSHPAAERSHSSTQVPVSFHGRHGRPAFSLQARHVPLPFQAVHAV